MSSTELAYPCRQLREVQVWRGARYMTDGVLHRTFSRQTDEMARVVQPLAIGEILGIGEVSPGRVFEGTPSGRQSPWERTDHRCCSRLYA